MNQQAVRRMNARSDQGRERERVVVVTGADGGYSQALAVMVRSLLENCRSVLLPVLYIVDGGISARDRDRILTSWDPYRIEIHWVKPHRKSLSGLPILKWYGPTIYLRFLVPALLPESVRKVIYIDADTLILEDLTPLWRTSLGGKPMGAAQDTGFLNLKSACFPAKELGLSPAGKYLNSGVLVMDLERWRRDHLAERILEFLREGKYELGFPDQDALNILLAGQWRQLHPRWNVVLDSAYRCLADLPRRNRLRLAQAIARPAILHFAAGPKPWEKKCAHRRLFLYYIYLDRTRWRGWRPD